jgi:uncharacterized SAM-binding protein YcdF (DUF218 family)
MLYACSKAFWFVVQPVHSLPLLGLLAVVFSLTGRWRAGLGIGALLALFLLVISLFPVGRWLLSPLENRFSTPRQMPSYVDGIIMLGGSENIAFADLARRYPKARLVSAGGGPIVPDSTSRNPEGRVPTWLGIDIGRIIFERKSRNTFEDVVVAKAIILPVADETWILVTNAAHMPRSVGLFRGQGWQVVPYPVDYASSPVYPPSAGFRQNLDQLSAALKEWIGMFANRVLGHSPEWFPGAGPSLEAPLSSVADLRSESGHTPVTPGRAASVSSQAR